MRNKLVPTKRQAKVLLQILDWAAEREIGADYLCDFLIAQDYNRALKKIEACTRQV